MQSGQQSGDYVFETKLGEGGLAEVWKVRSVSTQVELAVKLLPGKIASRRRFDESLVRLTHPNIVPVLRLEEFDGRPAFLMPFYRGGSLETRLRPTPGQAERKVGIPLPIQDALAISEDILSALEYAHSKQIIHRDVKPENILFNDLGGAYLADFETALDRNRRNLTEPGGKVGAAFYASPEQMQNPRAVDSRTDIYSLGCCLYDMLTGRPPFIPAETRSIETAQIKERPRPLRMLNPEVPEELNEIVMKALAKKPDERFRTCEEFARRLKALNRIPVASESREDGGDGIIQPSRVIRGHRFVELLGRGGIAEVWHVISNPGERNVAVKILLPEHIADVMRRDRFEREAHVAPPQHRHIVPIEPAEFAGRPATVMPFYTRGSLEARIRKTEKEREQRMGTPLSIGEALAISRQILSALECAHRQGYIHGDVKPENILFDAAGDAHLADFGITQRTAISEAGGYIESALYLSPEQARNPRRVDRRTDVYSFGCCLFDMVTGRPPFLSDEDDDAKRRMALRGKHAKEPPPVASSLNDRVPKELSDVIAKALSKRAKDRFAGCGEFAAALTRFQEKWGSFAGWRYWVQTLMYAAIFLLGLITVTTFVQWATGSR